MIRPCESRTNPGGNFEIDQADKNNTKYESNDSKRFHRHKTRTSCFFKYVYFKHWSLAFNCLLCAHLKKTALKGQNDGRLTANM